MGRQVVPETIAFLVVYPDVGKSFGPKRPLANPGPPRNGEPSVTICAFLYGDLMRFAVNRI